MLLSANISDLITRLGKPFRVHEVAEFWFFFKKNPLNTIELPLQAILFLLSYCHEKVKLYVDLMQLFRLHFFSFEWQIQERKKREEGIKDRKPEVAGRSGNKILCRTFPIIIKSIL